MGLKNNIKLIPKEIYNLYFIKNWVLKAQKKSVPDDQKGNRNIQNGSDLQYKHSEESHYTFVFSE